MGVVLCNDSTDPQHIWQVDRMVIDDLHSVFGFSIFPPIVEWQSQDLTFGSQYYQKMTYHICIWHLFSIILYDYYYNRFMALWILSRTTQVSQ